MGQSSVGVGFDSGEKKRKREQMLLVQLYLMLVSSCKLAVQMLIGALWMILKILLVDSVDPMVCGSLS